MEEDLPPNLVREGMMMRDSLMRDLHGHSLGVLIDSRVPLPDTLSQDKNIQIFTVDSSASLDSCWCQALNRADGVWLIAPETKGLLENLSSQVINSGKRLFGTSPEVVALTTDKYQTLKHLQSFGIECVPSWLHAEFGLHVPPPWITKPLDGVGCEGVRKLWSLPEAQADIMIQPFIEGESISLSALFDSGRAVLISINKQVIEETEGRFHLLGCQVNALQDPDGRWQDLCTRIATALPGLWGYAGIDLILQGDTPLILEINPRLTLSYVGLSRALGGSIATRVAAVACGESSLERVAAWRRRLKGREVWVSLG